ncbi:MAG: Uma2 family endonuclease, partial [Acidothermaceae bacterium]
ALLVTPGPVWEHQEVGLTLYTVLRAACPPGVRTLAAPFDVTFGTNDTTLQPDVFVARFSDMTRKILPAAPLLVAEVRSPSTAMIDLTLKKAAYARFGVESYWVLDPSARTLLAFELRAGDYVEAASLAPDDALDFERPFPVRISMPYLCRGLDPD